MEKSANRKRNADTSSNEADVELVEPISLIPSIPKKPKRQHEDSDVCFIGKPIPVAQAKERWPHRYRSKKKTDMVVLADNGKGEGCEEEEVLQAKFHYTQAMADEFVYNLNDDAYVKADDGMPNYIARIIEMFEGTDGESYFRAQWFYRAEDTVIKDLGEHSNILDKRRVFLSDVQDDNPLNCTVSKVKIAKVDLHASDKAIPPCDLYYDMKYTLPYLTFSAIATAKPENGSEDDDTSSTISSDTGSNNPIGDIVNMVTGESGRMERSQKSEMTLLDLYSGCGAMSTGLCIGASLSGVKLVTRWAVDINSHACKSLKLNHPETEVRNEAAEDFLSLLKEWEKLCTDFSLVGTKHDFKNAEEDEEVDNDDNDGVNSSEEFEVQKLLAVCYGDPNQAKKPGLYFKVRWKGYGPSDDTWEPMEGLSNCPERLKEFVTRGYEKNILPLPGDVDFVCGGPPCQGVSGFNRFRNAQAPLDDIKNRQLLVYMSIIEFLKPKYVLMENVVDILKFSGGFLGRYAIGRLVSMNYQARLGMMAAGSYGLPQFRMRVFLWGAIPTEKLPQYPLPTHEVVGRGVVPNEFEEITVAYHNKQQPQLEKALYLKDAISDMPLVTNGETEDQTKYGKSTRTEFQRYISLKRIDVVGYNSLAQSAPQARVLYDHRPLQLNQDDFERVCMIPKKKGANFRDLPGVLVGPDNKVMWDPAVERLKVTSGKPLVPDYAMSFIGGRSPKPFGRLWWDETVPTVVTRAEPHNQVILHPEQDRVLTIRENARLQGFPDFYQLCGPVKERYIQVGNAVAVPVGIALGYTFGLASQGLSDGQPLTTLPFKFPECLACSSLRTMEGDNSE